MEVEAYSANPDVALREAVNSVDFAGMVEFVEAGANVNYSGPDEGGHTALMDAVHVCPPEYAAFLIEAGADVNAQEVDRCTPLVHAMTCESIDVARTLIEAGARCDAVVVNGNRPLHFAAMGRTSELCRELLKAGADAQVCSDNGDTPLDAAINHKSLRNVATLLAASGLHQPKEVVGWHVDEDSGEGPFEYEDEDGTRHIVIVVDRCPCCTCPDCGRPYGDHGSDDDEEHSE